MAKWVERVDFLLRPCDPLAQLPVNYLSIAVYLETPSKLRNEWKKLGSFFPISRSFPKSGPALLVDFLQALSLVSTSFLLTVAAGAFFALTLSLGEDWSGSCDRASDFR